MTGKSDQLRGPGNGNQFTVYSETGIFLIYQAGQAPLIFWNRLLSSEPGAWAVLEQQ